MSLKIGIVGLPNVGKSTLFNALVKGSHAEAANYPFCTIEPNVGIVEVPDHRLKPLAEMSKSKKIVPAVIEFVDIAGLVRGASKGEGLGNKFLAAIRECDAIGMVVRFFEDSNVVHVEGKIDPFDDIKTIETELQLADISTVEKRLYSLEKELKSGSKESKLVHLGLQKIKDKLYAGENAREAKLDDTEKEALRGLGLMTQKPIIYIANCSEEQLVSKSVSQLASKSAAEFLRISAKLEAELNELNDEEKAEYLDTLGVKETGLNQLIEESYKTLGLQTYLTTGEMETRAWTIHQGDTAPKAAGVIHTDFEHGFIAAEIIPWQDLYAQGSWSAAKAHGLVRTEGKTYVMKDGDVVLFRFNV
ncbi:MAG: redox-regulated ATPase YchF [Candidatus Berkelbacteria bacterium]|nr:redox-regulated ATPase YchF [Candidatus Berkelbacteria bacterium]